MLYKGFQFVEYVTESVLQKKTRKYYYVQFGIIAIQKIHSARKHERSRCNYLAVTDIDKKIICIFILIDF